MVERSQKSNRGALREDHFAWFRMFHLTGECDIDLGARRVPGFHSHGRNASSQASPP